VVLDVRDPDVAKELRNLARRIIDLDDKTWHRRDGTEQLISNESEYLALSEAKFNLLSNMMPARVAGWSVPMWTSRVCRSKKLLL
jgi:predicted HAD superfamily phosphohydrolase YqeG